MQLPATESEIAALENPRFWRRNPYKVKEKKDWKAGLWALFFLGPNLILFLVFTAYPVWYGLYISLYNYSILKPKKWVGLGNYEKFRPRPQYARSDLAIDLLRGWHHHPGRWFCRSSLPS